MRLPSYNSAPLHNTQVGSLNPQEAWDSAGSSDLLQLLCGKDRVG